LTGQQPASASELAAQSADDLIDPTTIDAASLALVARVRDLVEAVVSTDVSPAERELISAELERLTATLSQSTRDPLIQLGRHRDGRLENFTQAGSGSLNPQSVPLDFDPLPSAPDPGQPPSSAEVSARFVLSAAHSGPPHKAHGGVVATILDEVLGVAATAAGASGLTGTLTVRYEAATPYGVPLVVVGRYTGSEGRKHRATGEILHEDRVTARGEAVYISAAR
jgi:acyl-coenzyme A thioesterase PaaI-like protein